MCWPYFLFRRKSILLFLSRLKRLPAKRVFWGDGHGFLIEYSIRGPRRPVVGPLGLGLSGQAGRGGGDCVCVAWVGYGFLQQYPSLSLSSSLSFCMPTCSTLFFQGTGKNLQYPCTRDPRPSFARSPLHMTVSCVDPSTTKDPSDNRERLRAHALSPMRGFAHACARAPTRQRTTDFETELIRIARS